MLEFGYSATHKLVMVEAYQQLVKAKDADEFGEVLNVPLILGPVGIGKTSILRSVAAELGLPLLKINCSECADPTDIVGLPCPWKTKTDGEYAYTEWLLNQQLHTACSEPVLLAFDDVDKVPPLVEGALIGILGERRARDRKLHPGTVLVLAGNRVGDDSMARELSESLRTRATTIFMSANLKDFSQYAVANPDKVDPLYLGFLSYRQEYLFKHSPDAPRFPTPRGWVEASSYVRQLDAVPTLREGFPGDPHEVAVALKCGEPVSKDFSAWYKIVRKVDVKKILLEGVVDHSLDATNSIMVEYAATFAVAQELNLKPIKPEYKGLGIYLKQAAPEHRVALLYQLTQKARDRIAGLLPEVADTLLADLIPVGGA